MKTLPTKSDSETLAPGEKEGELKVSVRERCCSAMTRREMRCWIPISISLYDQHMAVFRGSRTGTVSWTQRGKTGMRETATYRSENGVHEFVEILGVHEAAAFQDSHGQLRDDSQVALEIMSDNGAKLFIFLQRLDLL